MKKIALLTSILALTACSGGHHGGGTVGAPDNIVRGAVTADAQLSNSEITSMASEILVPTDGIGSSIVIDGARHSSGKVTHNGKEYDSYKLDDIDFTMAEVPDTESPNIIVKLKIEDQDAATYGKIIGAKIYNLHDQNIETIRDDETNRFSFDDGSIKAEFNVVMNNGKELGMKYADFGYLNMDWSESEQDEEPEHEQFAIAGGYAVKEIEHPTGIQEFTGHAYGNVRFENEAEDSSDNLPIDTKDAKLTFNNGQETLNMNFDKWYNVTVESKNGKSDITFDDTGKTIADNFKFQSNTLHDFTKYGNIEDAEDNTGVSGMLVTKYYGDNGIPTEATSVISVDEFIGDKEVTFSAAFGGKKQ